MSVIYKLGEGPINYEWNMRYITIKGKELTYFLTINSEEKRTINLEGAITSNICRIKGNKYSFALIIPIFQVLFFSTNSYQETLSFQKQIIQAASSSSFLKSKRANSSLSQIENEMINQYPISSSVNQSLFYAVDITTKIETLRKEIVFDEQKFKSYYIGSIQYSFPQEIPYDFWYIYIDILFYCLRLLTPVFIAYFLFLYSQYTMIIISFVFLISLCHIIMMKTSLFSYSSKINCSYISKSKTIISCNKDKVILLLRNNGLRSEWDNNTKTVHCFKDNEMKIDNDLIPAIDNFWISLLIKINDILTRKPGNSKLLFERMEFKDKEGNEYFLFKNDESKGNTLNNESPFELFMVKSIKDVYEEKTLVVYITNCECKNYDLSYSIRQYVKKQRLSVLNSLREYLISGDIANSIKSFL